MKTIYKTAIAVTVTSLLFTGCGDAISDGKGSNTNMQMSIDLSDYTQDALTDEQKYSLAYMWHEEKLAYDIYLALNTFYPAKQLENIATKSEIKHIKLVQDLVEWYDLNITNIPDYTINYSKEELTTMPAGIYAIDEIQNLYNTLYTKGKGSQQAALEVGCIVEVTDINDLDVDIALADSNLALRDTFNILRSGSYNHYWAFDKGLQNLGIKDGCCSLGVSYCHPEYPQNSKDKR
jgi:hypothetical protein